MCQYLSAFGTSISLYFLFNIVAIIVMIVFGLSRSVAFQLLLPDFGLFMRIAPRWRSVLEICIVILVFYPIASTINTSFGKWFTSGNANYFGNLTAWLITLIVIPLIFGVSPLRAMDVLSPALPLSLFVAKIACFCHGCCSGFEMPGSFYYNNYTNRYEFPVQMLESLVALGLFSFIRYYEKKNKLPGSVFPVYLINYSISRFLTEFIRADLPNVLGPLDAYQILSLIFALNGCVLLLALRNYGDKIEKVLSRNSN